MNFSVDNKGTRYATASNRLFVKYLKDERKPNGNNVNREEEIFNSVLSDYENDNRIGRTKTLNAIADIIVLRNTAKELNNDVDMLDVELNFARRCEEYVDRRRKNPLDARGNESGNNGEENRGVAEGISGVSEGEVGEDIQKGMGFNLKAREEILSIGGLDYSNQPSSKKNFERLLDEMQETLENSSFDIVPVMGDDGVAYQVDLLRDLKETFETSAAVADIQRRLDKFADKIRKDAGDSIGHTTDNREHFFFKTYDEAEAFVEKADGHLNSAGASLAIEGVKRNGIPETEGERICALFVLRGAIQYATRRIETDKDLLPSVRRGLLSRVLRLDEWNYPTESQRVKDELRAEQVDFSITATEDTKPSHSEKGGFSNGKVKAGTFFSGAGLVDYALRDVIDGQFAVEKDSAIAEAYALNHNGKVMSNGDVRDFKVSKHARELHSQGITKNCYVETSYFSRFTPFISAQRTMASAIIVRLRYICVYTKKHIW